MHISGNKIMNTVTLSALVATTAILGGGSVATAAPAPANGCADIQVVVNRGTGENGTIGSMRVVSDRIVQGTAKTVAVVGNPYPASFSFSSSTPAGVRELNQELTEQSAACPNQRFVLLGYSQGAMVIGDTLGASSFGRRSGPQLPAAVGNKVIASVMWGDPRFNSAEPFNAGTFRPGVNGSFARPTGQLSAFNDRMLNFCLSGDGVCQGNGSLRINAGHLAYPRNNAAIQASADFALSRIDGQGAGSGLGASPVAPVSPGANGDRPRFPGATGERPRFPRGDGFGLGAPRSTSESAPAPRERRPWWQRLLG